ncbi:glycosyltransferase [Pseudoalteromonas sp. NEC-BIFX-2020_002]|uniref:glycosyltransferase n=1 Tax=Pseudoalteromonas sp. NEC-BIFX-2020_002 TaxID=2732353 RepID=UPI001476C80B|nr:glycosyltransferase [Pseudoalteromonas sp. NEC-BIFX-2020_002]NNG45153.1 glycosyltransferase [Pseudoalteromonas sp. NEC-BIFX-2020_002]
MKILLIGEFSAVHKNLKDGLVALGHDVTIAANGNGWKSIPCDIDISIESQSLLGRLQYRKMLMDFISSIKGYDVVQFVNPFVFPGNLFPFKSSLKKIKKNNGAVFLLAAGSDAYFWKYGREKLSYGPFNDYLKYDLKASTHHYESKKFLQLNDFFAKNVDGIIPVMHEYRVSYEHCDNMTPVVPLPVNVDDIQYSENNCVGKLVVFHGLNRPGFKGTHYVREAFEILRSKYPDELDLVIDGKMPLDKYLKLMSQTNIIIDQTNSYSLGLNGIFALAMGKVVLGGAEPESFADFNIKSAPYFNIQPNKDSIVEKVEYLLHNKHLIPDIGMKSRAFAEQVHGHLHVAEKFLQIWQQRDGKHAK